MKAFTETDARAPAQSLTGQADGSRHRIGPNAIIQTRMALLDLCGADACRTIFLRAGLRDALDRDPPGMVEEQRVISLFRAIGSALPAADAGAVLRRSGCLTGQYILANRIPMAAQNVLRMLAEPVSKRLLLRAIAAHAWTFAGSGSVKIETWSTCAIEIAENPIATPGCVWHLGVFETLFGAFSRHPVKVRHITCCALGDNRCRTEIG